MSGVPGHARAAPRPGARVLVAALVALAVLYLGWFGSAREWVAVAVFALPPLGFALAVARGSGRAAIWASIIALLWFCHGVMAAWTTPDARVLALAEVALSVLVVFAAGLPGLRARFGRGPG